MRRLGADPGQPELLGHGGDERNGAVGGDGEHALDVVSPRHVGHRADVREVDRLAGVRDLEPQRLGVPVDGDDTKPELLRAEDRTALVAPGADEEDGGHVARDAIRGSTARSARLLGAAGSMPGTRKASFFARAIWQPSRTVSLTQTLLPWKVPEITASCGPP